MKDFWNKRYAACNTFYGEEPNRFFKQFIDSLPEGRILLPGEGEGRNAIYAARNGWGVDAFDFSEKARANAAEKAEDAGVMLHYELKDIADYKATKLYDVIALVYVHLPNPLRVLFHKQLEESLKPGGYIIMEAFSKKQAYSLTGPEDVSLLYSADDIRNDFPALNVVLCEENEIELTEGGEHKNKAHVVHFIAHKEIPLSYIPGSFSLL